MRQSSSVLLHFYLRQRRSLVHIERRRSQSTAAGMCYIRPVVLVREQEVSFSLKRRGERSSPSWGKRICVYGAAFSLLRIIRSQQQRRVKLHSFVSSLRTDLLSSPLTRSLNCASYLSIRTVESPYTSILRWEGVCARLARPLV